MNRKTWSSEPGRILEVVNTLIDGRFLVSLQRKSGPALRTRVVQVHYRHGIAYLLLHKPSELQDSRLVRALFFKMQGLPVLGFSCPITRESETLMATMLPRAMYQLELREFARLEPLQGSMATFFIHDRSRVSICMMENIGMGGVKLVGRPVHAIQARDVIGPCTLSLAGRDALINREVTISKATVARVERKRAGADQLGLGIKFELSEAEKGQLKEHLDFLSNQK